MLDFVGRVCVKVRGREASRKCVIIDISDKNFVVITGPPSLTGVKRRKVNISHLAFTPHKISIERNASDEEVLEKLRADNLMDFMKEEVRVAV